MNPWQQYLCGLNVLYTDYIKTCVISGFPREVDEISALMGYRSEWWEFITEVSGQSSYPRPAHGSGVTF